MNSVDAVIVHHHAAQQACDAVASLRADASASDLDVRVLIVDNGSTQAERALLSTAAACLLDPGRNVGYAGAINLGFQFTRADVIFVLNEDVLVEPGCLAALVRELGSGASVAGPRFFWDRARTFMLPCTEERTRVSEVRRMAARRDLSKLARARAVWREQARDTWLAPKPVHTVSLSGALLAFRRDAWAAIGPFDDGYPLYFEENDWLIRAERAGLRCAYVPQALAVHLHQPSPSQSAQRLAWHDGSFRRFGSRYYGAHFMRRLERLASAPAVVPQWDTFTEWPVPAPMWLEVSPSRFGFPAAAARVERGADTASLLRSLDFVAGDLYVQLVTEGGAEVARGVLIRTVPGA